MTALARPDLSARKALSKSALNGYAICPTASWFDLHAWRPMIPNEPVSFGSALDRAVERLVLGDFVKPADLAAEASAWVAKKDGIVVSVVELTKALAGFASEVMPRIDWTGVRTQVELRADIEGLGTVEGHPDILLPGCVLDVKSSAKSKQVPSLELGLYTLLVEAAEGGVVHEVGYLTWIRKGSPEWAIQTIPTSDELRRWAWENAAQYARLMAVDAQLNEGAESATNYVFAGGPAWPSKCQSCQYAPAFGGDCAIAYGGGSDD